MTPVGERGLGIPAAMNAALRDLLAPGLNVCVVVFDGHVTSELAAVVNLYHDPDAADTSVQVSVAWRTTRTTSALHDGHAGWTMHTSDERAAAWPGGP